MFLDVRRSISMRLVRTAKETSARVMLCALLRRSQLAANGSMRSFFSFIPTRWEASPGDKAESDIHLQSTGECYSQYDTAL